MQRAPRPDGNVAPLSERDGGKVRRVHPDDEADMRAAMAEIAAGRTVEVTAEELDEWTRTGELPASVEARVLALGCDESRS
jgi:hypothetical protein